MAANGNGTADANFVSFDIIHRLQDLRVSSTSNAIQQLGALSIQPPPAPPPFSPPANNPVSISSTTLSTWPPAAANNCSSSCSKGCDSSKKIMASKLGRLRRRRLIDRRRPPSVVSITDELQNLMVGAAAFRPTPEELVGRFLRPKLAGGGGGGLLPRAARFIHDADVYAAAPDHLAATHAPAPAGGGAKAKLAWYFFSPLYLQPDRRLGKRPCRRVAGGGIWKPTTGRCKLGEEGEAANWYGKNLAYCDHEVRRTEWRMCEYGIGEGDGHWQQPLVLCELFRSPSSSRGRRRGN